MSIYALPGALHELISSSRSSSIAKSSCRERRVELEEASSSSFTDIDAPSSNPLHRRPSLGSDSSDHSASSCCSLGSSSGRNAGANGNVKIAVKEAKIDPERLIRSLSSSSSSDAKKAAAAKHQGSSADELSTSGNSRECDPHEDAIKFEINVTFNGREYTATRTLPRILQFRCDLIEEFRARRKWRERRRKRKETEVPQMAKVKDPSDDEEEDTSIPELPRLADDRAHGNGFTMLNALLRPYGFGVERWLLKVLDIVPHDSQCLTQFLWEPLSGATNTKRYERMGSSAPTLVAIQEAEADDLGYDSDTDNYLLIH
jgi:hypothetical protein